MPIDWKAPESHERLLGAMVAAADKKIDCKKVAYYFGKGATYDAIEGRLRKAKKLAQQLISEVKENGTPMPTNVRAAKSSPAKPRALRKLKMQATGVATGRVEKCGAPKDYPPKVNRHAVADAAKETAGTKGEIGNSVGELSDEAKESVTLDNDADDEIWEA